MNLNDIIQAAQGGEGVANLGAQFGLTPEQTQAAVQALMPAFSTALQRVTAATQLRTPASAPARPPASALGSGQTERRDWRRPLRLAPVSYTHLRAHETDS